MLHCVVLRLARLFLPFGTYLVFVTVQRQRSVMEYWKNKMDPTHSCQKVHFKKPKTISKPEALIQRAIYSARGGPPEISGAFSASSSYSLNLLEEETPRIYLQSSKNVGSDDHSDGGDCGSDISAMQECVK